MSSSSTVETTIDSTFVCDCHERARSACAEEAFYNEHEGKRYCVFHFPKKEKAEAFDKALKRKLRKKDFNFRGFWFPDETSFSNFRFSEKVDFASAIFNEKTDFILAEFNEEADFSRATFRAKTYFTNATFKKRVDFNNTVFKKEIYFSFIKFNENVSLMDAVFEDEVSFMLTDFNAEAYFYRTRFIGDASFKSTSFNMKAGFYHTIFNAGAMFDRATFNGEANFWQADFNLDATFTEATFESYVIFSGSYKKPVRWEEDKVSPGKFPQGFKDTSSLDLQYVRVSKPDRVSYHTLTLRPHWFVNVDASNFDFTNVDWNWRDISEEVESLQRKDISSPHRLLAIAYRHLASNAEKNVRYEEASKFSL